MPRIRSIKPQAFTSISLSSVSRGARWTFAGIWTDCDDSGRAIYDPRLVKAAVYPVDDGTTIAMIKADVAELVGIGAVCLYTVGGKSFLHVPAWEDHQHPNRPRPSRIPECPKTSHYCQVTSTSVANTSAAEPAPAPAMVVEGTSAQTIIAEWIDKSHKRPPAQVIGQMARLIGQMLEEGIDPDDVRRGIAAWMAKGLHPSTLPSVVNEVMNRPAPVASSRVTAGLDVARALMRDEPRDVLALGL